MDDPRDRRIAELEAENAELRRRIAQLEHQVQTFLQRRKRAKKKTEPRAGTPDDRRRKEHRKHPGVFRPEPPPDTAFIEHDVHRQQCSHCGSVELEDTGQFEDHIVADIPEPKLEWHRYRRHIHRCRNCEQTCRGRGDLELPGAHIGPRARLLACYGRAHLGISLGKTRDLLHDAIQLGKDREGMSKAAFRRARQQIRDRFDDLVLNCHSRNADCVRIWKRPFKHCDELFTVLDDPRVPADNNGCERDIRSLAAARNDGGVHRAEWSAAAFARIKSAIVTSLKNGLRFIHYGMAAVQAQLQGEQQPPLPLSSAD